MQRYYLVLNLIYIFDIYAFEKVKCTVSRLEVSPEKTIGSAEVPDELFVSSSLYSNQWPLQQSQCR